MQTQLTLKDLLRVTETMDLLVVSQPCSQTFRIDIVGVNLPLFQRSFINSQNIELAAIACSAFDKGVQAQVARDNQPSQPY